MAATKDFLDFSGGLITEATPLNFPENAFVDAANVILNRDASVQRRKGIEYEESYTLNDSNAASVSDFNEFAVDVFVWRNAGNDALNNFAVVQVGKELHLYDMSDDAAISNNQVYTIDLSNYSTGNYSNEHTYSVQVASGKGYLFVVGKHIEPFFIYYDGSSFTETQIEIKVRDFTGVDDGLEVDERPPALSDEHKYNLLNQGWPSNYISKFASEEEDTGSVVAGTDGNIYKCIQYHLSSSTNRPVSGASYSAYWQQDNSLYGRVWENDVYYSLYQEAPSDVYPSNVDVWALGKYTNVDNGREAWSASQMKNQNIGNTPAPKGHFILNAFELDRGNVSGVSSIGGFPERSRPSTVAFFAGRAWYSGVRSEGISDQFENLSGNIYFSQTITDDSKIGKCYQDADPTSEDISDLIDTDGGVITIPEAGEIKKLLPLVDKILVFADNGVWEIGNETGGFSATKYSVNKITGEGAINSSSIVFAEGNVIYFAKSGIYGIGANENGIFVARNLTDKTIQGYYTSIPNANKKYAKAYYDPVARKISWLFSEETKDNNYHADTELVFDLILGAYYKHEIASKEIDSPYIAGAVVTQGIISDQVNYNVVDSNNEQVVVTSGEDVIITDTAPGSGEVALKYLAVVPRTDGVDYTFASYKNTDFLDWDTEDYSSYIITGYDKFEDTMRKKQLVYGVFHFKKTETGFFLDGNGDLQLENPSSCKIQAHWDFHDTASGNMHGEEFQAYRFRRPYIPSGDGDNFDTGETVITTKNKIRGYGKALSLKLSSEQGKDFHVYGWGLEIQGRGKV